MPRNKATAEANAEKRHESTRAQLRRMTEEAKAREAKRVKEAKPTPHSKGYHAIKAKAKRAVNKERQRIERERKATEEAEAAILNPSTPRKRGRPFGKTGGYFKPWMKRVLGNFYTDVDLVRDFILVDAKDRLQLLQDLDPKTFGEGSPEEVAARIKAALEAISSSVPKPD